MTTDTIAAIATAPGRSALAIVRVSGPEAIRVVAARFQGADLTQQPSHTAHVGWLVDGAGEEVDQVVVTLFRAPRSATGEDVAEVSCHGGAVVPQQVLRALLQAGAVPAEPGEFTQRAFLNGKLDLTRAEAVAALIHAESSLAHRVSAAHVRGRYADRLARARQQLLQTCALIELELDFAEEDVDFAERSEVQALLEALEKELAELIGSYELGAIVRGGVRVVIGGRPNAGKSTLLNALVGFDRAIVSQAPGTTRDAIEAETEIRGLRFRFVDTAGLRNTADLIEREGVRRAEDAARGADVLLYVFDAACGLDEGERVWLDRLRSELPSLPVLLVSNKADLNAETADDVLPISAHRALADQAALQPLHSLLLQSIRADVLRVDGGTVVMDARHHRHLVAAREAVQRAQEGVVRQDGGDTMALDLRDALHHLGAITGAATSDDVLGAIFSQFCIGK